MDTSKLSRYDWVVVGSMILMFVALFLTWYASRSSSNSFGSCRGDSRGPASTIPGLT